MRINPLIGKRVIAVYLAEYKMALKFDVEGSASIVVNVDADCCSETWIENIETPENLIGTVSAVEDVEMPDLGEQEGHYVMAYYGCKIHTEKGSCLIDYRNDSNGYYGGSLSWPHSDYFYGGVYGQNISKEDWRQIA
jgi:hypothetical protein